MFLKPHIRAGEACSHDERYTAAQKVGKMKGERGSSKVNICDGLGEIPARVMEVSICTVNQEVIIWDR